MKNIFGYIGFMLACFIGLTMLGEETPNFVLLIIMITGWIAGRKFYEYIEEEIDRQKKEKREEREREERKLEERKERERQKKEVLELVQKYPKATKSFFKKFWNKRYNGDHQLTDEKVKKLLEYKNSFEDEERRLNADFRAKLEEKEKAERLLAQERKRKELAEQRKREEELRNLPKTLSACVSGWTIHRNSSIRHKFFYDYYPYRDYKDKATSSMRTAWKTVWQFKGDPETLLKVPISRRSEALDNVVTMVTNELRTTFGSNAKHLTLVCVPASTQIKTEERFKVFSERVCTELNMGNAINHIHVTEDSLSKHLGGSGSTSKSYDSCFFNGKYIILFDDVRTTGKSLENEKKQLEQMGATVIGAITIAQTKR